MHCTFFHRQFTDRRIKKGVMLKVLKQAGLRKKKVEVCSVPARQHERLGEFHKKTVELDDKLESIYKEKDVYLVYLDECVFKSRGF